MQRIEIPLPAVYATKIPKNEMYSTSQLNPFLSSYNYAQPSLPSMLQMQTISMLQDPDPLSHQS